VSTERDFEQLARDLERLESVTEGWTAEQQATVRAIRSTVEAIQVGAFRRLIRSIRDEPGGLDALARAVEDPWVQGVLQFNGLLRAPQPSRESRVEAALESVRPMLATHGGNVELVEVVSDQEVHIKLEGSCDGCAHSDITVRQGIETAIKEAVPSVERVKVVSGRPSDALVQLPGIASSPFAQAWQDLCGVDQVAEGQLTALETADTSVVVTMVQGQPRAFRNACAHLGMPLDEGRLEDGILTCPYHGFQFAVGSGECLTAPEIQLPTFPARIEGDRVLIQVAS
jgi:nitrite reductase/ring-hydroxylating ferredoxin subunit/Fe-S cluster biogenesis protein NfuA